MNSNETEYLGESSNKNLDFDAEILNRAREGNSFAQLDIAKSFCLTLNPNRNVEKAFHWFMLSAKQGNMEAQLKLGDMYALGQGTEINEHNAYDCYLKSAIQGYPKALTRVHNLYHSEKNMYCRGQKNSKEAEWTTADFKKEKNIRELYEYRVQQLEPKLTKIKEYFARLLTDCREIIDDDEVEDKQDAYLKLGFLYQHGYGIRKIRNRAIEFYTLAAEKGNVDAAYNLGNIYHHSLKMKWNYRESFKWYTKAAEKGQIYACNRLAFLYLKGLGTDMDYSKAIGLFTKAAEGCSISAMISLAKIFRKGKIVEKDYGKSAEWYKKAAIEGSAVAQSSLELLYVNKHVPLDETDRYLEKVSSRIYSRKGLVSRLRSDISRLGEAADLKKLKRLAMNAMKGDAYAMLDIGMKYYDGDYFLQDKDVAFTWIRNAAKSGIATIQCIFAKMYRDGDCVEQSYLKASIWYERAAKKGDVQARYNLGLMYYHGLGVRKDPLEASRWYTFAADKNDSDAQCQLGILRENGEGLRQDLADALFWFNVSAKQNNPQALYRLARIYENGTAEKKNFILAFVLYKKAAQLGSVDAQLKLANVYSIKEIQHDNKVNAFKYYEMAANQGSPEAKYKLAIMYLDGKGVNKDFIQAYHLLKESSDLGYDNAINIFNIPIDYSKTQDIDYNKIANMFKLICKNGIDSLEYNLWCHYNSSTYENMDLKHKWLLTAITKHVPEAHYKLAVIYEERNKLSRATKYYKSACRLGNVDAIYILACMYLVGYGVSQNFKKAFSLFSNASKKGHMEARKFLDILEIDNQNEQFGLIKKMLQVSANSGNTISQYKLGILALALNNESAEINTREAKQWLKMASRGGFIEASYKLGLLYEKNAEIEHNYQEVIKLYQVAADKGHEMALFRLAQIYHIGDKVEIDYLKAYEFYILAAQQGYQPAQLATNITTETIWNDNKNGMNDDLETLHLDYGSCFRMWEHIADDGKFDVQYKLGLIYEQNGGDSNMVQAAKWYFKAACGSNKNALYSLGRLYDTGLGVDRDYRKAIELYETSGDLNNYQALYQLGVIYENGKGVKPDFETAHYYYMRSAKKGNSAAQFALGRFYEEGKYLPRNNLEALKWYSLSALQGNKDAESYLNTHYDETYDSTLFYSRKVRLFSRIIKLCHHTNQQNNTFLGSFNYELGYIHHYGYSASVNHKEAWEHYWKASALYGNDRAREMLTIKYESVDVSTKDKYLKKLEMFEGVIERLSIEDIYELGSIFYHGVHSYARNSKTDQRQVIVQPDYHKSLKYFRMITERDLPVISDYYTYCSYYLGMIYFVDIKHTNDSSKAQYYLINALKSGSSDAQLFLDYINDENTSELDDAVLFEEVFKWHKNNQNKTRYKCIYNIGWMYEKGLGTQQDYEEAVCYYKILANSILSASYFKSKHDYLISSEVEQECTTCVDWYTKSTFQSNKIVNYNLGNIYFKEQDYKLALRYYKTADQEDCNVQNQLGIIYKNGYGVEQNYATAIEWFNKAANQNHVTANCNLGDIYFYGKGVEKDYGLALRYYSVAGNQGNSDAQTQLGTAYEKGIGVEQDYRTAIQWYIKASNKSHAIASYNLGNLYKKVKHDTKLALQHFKDATVQGNIYVQHKLVYKYTEFLGVGVESFSQSSNEGNDAMVMLGGLYHSINNAMRNFAKALNCYKNTNKNSIYWSYALRGIGLLYECGDGVERNYEKAFDYYRQSADRQNKGGYYNIALLYYYGKGVEKNYVIALDWFKKVVESKLDKSNVYVFTRVKKITKHNTAVVKKKEYSMVSETVIYREAHYYLSLMYNQGQGTNKYYETALYHFKIANSLGV